MDPQCVSSNEFPKPNANLEGNNHDPFAMKNMSNVILKALNEDMSYPTTISRPSPIPLTEVLYASKDMTEDILFLKNGYKKLGVITDTLQGKLYKAELFKTQLLNNNEINNHCVAIKKCKKKLLDKHIAYRRFLKFKVSENIIKEAYILQYLTAKNPFDDKCKYITKYIDFIESDDTYYLVMEYIESEMNLKQFINLSFEYIKIGKMELYHYQKVIKCIFWQLAVTIRWLHQDMDCCHLDLCAENVMLTNCHFTQDRFGFITVSSQIRIRLCDFGVAEVFQLSFKCKKQRLSIKNESRLAPEILLEIPYNATKADTWSLGMMLFECMTGQQLYDDIVDNRCWSLYNGKLKECLLSDDLIRYFNASNFDLLCHLLDTKANRRYGADDIIKHGWFAGYYKKYGKSIWSKSKMQREALMNQRNQMQNFPYYSHQTPEKFDKKKPKLDPYSKSV